MSNELLHYASPYYDPVKAHEYYMEHRKLKGRKSTKDFTEEEKATAEYVKSKIYEERDRNIETVKEELQSNIDDIKTQIQDLKDLSAEERANKKAEINDRIESLKKDAELRRNELLQKLGIDADDTSSKIEARNRQAQNAIDQLKIAMKYSSSDDPAYYEELRTRISKILEDASSDNAKDKEAFERKGEEVETEYDKISESTADSIQKARDDLANFNEENKAIRDSNIKELRSGITSLRKETKDKIADIRKGAEETYLSELDKIRADRKASLPSRTGSSSSKGEDRNDVKTATKAEQKVDTSKRDSVKAFFNNIIDKRKKQKS